MSESAFKQSIAEISREISRNSTVLKELEKNGDAIRTVVDAMFQMLEDLSKKEDLRLSSLERKGDDEHVAKDAPKKTTGDSKSKKKVAKKKVAKKKVAKKKAAPNVMSYFKKKYMEDAKFFAKVLEENQDKALFIEKKKEIAARKPKEREKTKATMLYKILTTAQVDSIRAIMKDEIEASKANTKDDIEPEVISD